MAEEKQPSFPGKAEEKGEQPSVRVAAHSRAYGANLDRLFDDFGVGLVAFARPARGVFRRRAVSGRGEGSTWGKAPAVDIAEHEKAYEITVELPGNGRE